FDSIILGHESNILKSADVAEFEFAAGVLRRVDPMLTQPGGSPKPSDGTRSGAPADARFPSTAAIVDRLVRASDGSLTPMTPYEIAEGMGVDMTAAGTMPSQFQPMTPGEGGN